MKKMMIVDRFFQSKNSVSQTTELNRFGSFQSDDCDFMPWIYKENWTSTGGGAPFIPVKAAQWCMNPKKFDIWVNIPDLPGSYGP